MQKLEGYIPPVQLFRIYTKEGMYPLDMLWPCSIASISQSSSTVLMPLEKVIDPIPLISIDGDTLIVA